MDKKPTHVPDDAWVMICGYLAMAYGNEVQKMSAGLCNMLYKQGFEIKKFDRRRQS